MVKKNSKYIPTLSPPPYHKFYEDAWRIQGKDWNSFKLECLSYWKDQKKLNTEELEGIKTIYEELFNLGANILLINQNLTHQRSQVDLIARARAYKDGPWWVKKGKKYSRENGMYIEGPGLKAYRKRTRIRERKVLEERREALNILSRHCKERGVDSTPLLSIFKELNKIDSDKSACEYSIANVASAIKERLPKRKFIDPFILRLQKDLVDHLASFHGMKKKLGAMDYAAKLCFFTQIISSKSPKTIEHHYQLSKTLPDSFSI